jgi:hypothetical protein
LFIKSPVQFAQTKYVAILKLSLFLLVHFVPEWLAPGESRYRTMGTWDFSGNGVDPALGPSAYLPTLAGKWTNYKRETIPFNGHKRVTRDLSQRVVCHHKLPRMGRLARNSFRIARNPLATGREFSMNPQIPSGERVFLDSENKSGSGDQFA